MTPIGAILDYVLRHTDLCANVRALCSLLCCSQATADAVHRSCEGELTLVLDSSMCSCPQLYQWLSKHAVLLRCLDQLADIRSFKAGAPKAAEGLAAALRASSSRHGGLKIRTLSTFSVPVAMAASCSSLVDLRLQLPASTLKPSCDEASAAIAGEEGFVWPGSSHGQQLPCVHSSHQAVRRPMHMVYAHVAGMFRSTALASAFHTY